jgi:hypothetical protein
VCKNISCPVETEHMNSFPNGEGYKEKLMYLIKELYEIFLS